jgi:hypothetical protein
MANEVTVFTPQFEDALYQAFDPIRMFAKEDSVGAGAKTVSIPVSGGITFANITATGHSYPRAATDRGDSETTYDLTQIEVNPFRIGNWEEFVMNAKLRESVFNEVAGVLGNYAIREIMTGFWNGDSDFEFATTGTNTYTNRHNETTCKSLTISDVAGLARKMDLQGVPRDGQRYLVLDPDMYTGFILELAAIGYEDTATAAFRTGELPMIHGFKVVQLQQTNHVTGSNVAVQTPGTASSATHLNAGLAIHKNFVGFAASGVKLHLQEDNPEYYGGIISGSFYAGGAYRRATPIGCLTIYEGA